MNKISFPFGGLNENNSYEEQPIGTCSDCLNVRGYDPIKGRLRGGQRPGLSKFSATEINSGATIQDLNRIKSAMVKTDGLDGYILVGDYGGYLYKVLITDGTKTEIFNTGGTGDVNNIDKDSAGNVYIATDRGLIASVYRSVVKIDSDGTVLWIYDTGVTCDDILFDSIRNRVVVVNQGVLTVLDASSGGFIYNVTGRFNTIKCIGIDSTGQYYVGSWGATWDGLKRSFWKLNSNDGSVVWAMSFDDSVNSAYDFDINSDDEIILSSAAHVATYGLESPLAGPAANVWQLDTDGTILWNDVVDNGSEVLIYTCTWSSDGDFYLGFKGTAADPDNFKKIALSNRAVVWDYSHGALVSYVFEIYEDEAGDYVYESGSNTGVGLKQLTIDGSGSLPIWEITTGENVSALHAGAGGTSSEGATVEALTIISEGDIYKSRAGSISLITNGTGAMAADSWVASQAAFGKMFFVDGASSLYYEPKYTPADEEIAVWDAASGSLPISCNLVALYRGRIVLARTPGDPYNWYMSKVGDPTDWDYFPATTSAIQAVAGNNSNAGLIGDVITAIVPWSDDVCIFGCDSSIWAMSGDPAAGGSIDKVTDRLGITFGKAWAFDPSGVMYFHSLDGIYRLAPNEKPVPLTHGKLKRRLESWDLSSYYVRLVWDANQQGLHVMLIAQNYASVSTYLFWDQRSDAWWLDSYPATIGPSCIYPYDSDDVADRYTLFGSLDGYIRKISNSATTDDGTGINSYVDLGPYVASPGKSLTVTEADIILATGSGDVDFITYSGKYGESLTSPTARVKRQLKAGLNRRVCNRTKSAALKFRLQSPATVTTQWATEKVALQVKESGVIRRGRV